jgi:hypothetical protein
MLNMNTKKPTGTHVPDTLAHAESRTLRSGR